MNTGTAIMLAAGATAAAVAGYQADALARSIGAAVTTRPVTMGERAGIARAALNRSMNEAARGQGRTPRAVVEASGADLAGWGPRRAAWIYAMNIAAALGAIVGVAGVELCGACQRVGHDFDASPRRETVGVDRSRVGPSGFVFFTEPGRVQWPGIGAA